MNPNIETASNLTVEEQFLWQSVRNWRQPERLSEAKGPDWSKVVETGKWNRMQTLLSGVLTATGQIDELPAESRTLLDEDAEHLRRNADMMGESRANTCICSGTKSANRRAQRPVAVRQHLRRRRHAPRRRCRSARPAAMSPPASPCSTTWAWASGGPICWPTRTTTAIICTSSAAPRTGKSGSRFTGRSITPTRCSPSITRR